MFTTHTHIHTLLELQNCQQLNASNELLLNEILLNISADDAESPANKNTPLPKNITPSGITGSPRENLPIESLNIPLKLQSCNGELVVLAFQMMGNFLSKD
jgi:hypothetical protein